MDYPTMPSNCRREQYLSTRCVPLNVRVGVLPHSTLLMQTAQVVGEGDKGNHQKIRVLLDTGSNQ